MQVKELRVKDMNELYHKLVATFFLVVLHIILQVGAKNCYITQSSGDKSKNGGVDSILQWQNITDTQIASCTKLQFSASNYTLIRSLKIIAVSDFVCNSAIPL